MTAAIRILSLKEIGGCVHFCFLMIQIVRPPIFINVSPKPQKRGRQLQKYSQSFFRIETKFVFGWIEFMLDRITAGGVVVGILSKKREIPHIVKMTLRKLFLM